MIGLPSLMVPDPSQRKVTPDSFQIILNEYFGKPELKSRAPDGKQCEAETKGLLGRAAIVAKNLIPVGKETDRHWEQGEGPSMLDSKIEIYTSSGKLVIADESERQKWSKIGVRRLMRATKLTQPPVYSILSGKGGRETGHKLWLSLELESICLMFEYYNLLFR